MKAEKKTRAALNGKKRITVLCILSVILQAIIYGIATVTMAVLEVLYVTLDGTQIGVSVVCLLPSILIPLVMLLSILAFTKYKWIEHLFYFVSAMCISLMLSVAPHVLFFEGLSNIFKPDILVILSLLMALWPLIFVLGNVVAIILVKVKGGRVKEYKTRRLAWKAKNSNRLNLYLSVNLGLFAMFTISAIYCPTFMAAMFSELGFGYDFWISFLWAFGVSAILMAIWAVLQIPAIIAFKLREPFGTIFAIVAAVVTLFLIVAGIAMTFLIGFFGFLYLFLPLVGILIWIFFGPAIVVAEIIYFIDCLFSLAFLIFRKRYSKKDAEYDKAQLLKEASVIVVDAEPCDVADAGEVADASCELLAEEACESVGLELNTETEI